MSSKDLDNSKELNPEEGNFQIEDEEEFIHSLDEGVTEDTLNLKRLVFWVVTGLSLVVMLIIIAYNIYTYNSYEIEQQVNDQSVNYQISQKRAQEHQILTSYGIVDLKKGLYRIPIDSAISLYVKENQNTNSPKENK
ncbi:MAG TPA: hypothetical protein VJ991_09780 [Balneolales bacterium]|nr:hypothetical protein [Balneolales bacterium]